MGYENLKDRTKKFALDILDFVEALPDTTKGRVIRWQLGRSGTSVGANYRAACRARSKADFISKIGVVIEEADESAFWLELTMDSGTLAKSNVAALLDEANQLTAIMTTSRKTAEASSGNKARSKNQNSAFGTRHSEFPQ
jgi:four helix bundle protein